MKSTKIVCILIGLLAFYSAMSSAETSIHFKSQAGDYIGQGKDQTWTTADGTFAANSSNSNVLIFNFNNGSFWSLNFAAPVGQQIKVGAYEKATRYPFNSPTGNGLSISGDGRGCNTLTGRFDVLEAVYDAAGKIKQFAANFEQHCEGGQAALFGTLRYNATVGYPAAISVSANASHTPITVKVGDIVNIATAIDAGDDKNSVAEKWLGVLSARGNYWYRYGKWSLQKFPLQSETSPIITTQKAARWKATKPGVYFIMFVVDKTINNALESEYVDYVVVNVK